MARTNQTARKRYKASEPRKTTHQFSDHTGSIYTVYDPNSYNPISKLSIHLYCLGPLHPGPEDIAQELLRTQAISGWGNACNKWPRVDVYQPLESIEACIEHHRREKIHRRKAKQEMHDNAVASATSIEEAEDAVAKLGGKEPLPHIVPTWCPSSKLYQTDPWSRSGSRYRSFILVVPRGCSSWRDIEQNGLWLVKFDQDVTVEMEVSMLEDEFCDEDRFDNPEDWVFVGKIDYGPPISIQRAALESEVNNADLPVGGLQYETDLEKEWMSYTGMFSQCTYSSPCCDGCDEGLPHDPCEYELDEHFFDEDGQCIACRRFTEYRRRSKRLATQKQTDH